MKDDFRDNFPREFNASKQLGFDGNAFFVGGNNLGDQQAAVAQHEPPCPALLHALSPADQIGGGQDAMLLSGTEGDLPTGVDGQKFRAERLAHNRHGQWRLGRFGG